MEKEFMFPIERHKAILELLKKRGSITVSGLCGELFVAEATIRRDLKILEEAKLLVRTYGGAVVAGMPDTDTPFMFRDNERQEAKLKIADTASQFIKNGQTIFMDSSSTVLRLKTYLKNYEHLAVITNGLRTAYELGGLGIKVICTGGTLNNSATTLVGSAALEYAGRYCADVFFLSCMALSLIDGFTDSSEEGGAVKLAMVKNSKKIILMADSEKFNKSAFFRLNLADCIDYIVTDKTPSDEWYIFAEKTGAKILV